MEKAEKTAQLVKKDIDSSLFLKETLKKGLINYSELARQILPKIKSENKKANFSSVLIAIQRYYDEISKTKYINHIKEYLPGLEIITKNKIMTLSFERNKKVMSQLNNVAKNIRWDAGDIMFFIQGTSEVTVIADMKNEKKFDIIKKELIEKRDRLAMLSVREPEGKQYSKDMIGFMALLTATLSDKDINIYEVATTFKQEIFIIHEKDITKAYESFEMLTKD